MTTTRRFANIHYPVLHKPNFRCGYNRHCLPIHSIAKWVHYGDGRDGKEVKVKNSDYGVLRFRFLGL